jgi:hypothetical protein
MAGDNLPRSYRPLYNEYLAVAAVIKLERNIYDMTPQEFQTQCMIHSNGVMNPKRALDIYNELMYEAGL